MEAGTGTVPRRTTAPPGERRAARAPEESGWFGVLADVAGILTLAWRTVRTMVTPPYSWGGDLLDQSWIVVRRCAIPIAISAFAFGFGAPGVQGGNINSSLGTIDRLGINFSAASVREFVPWITGMVVAGVAGTAICADLGARKVRDELDALAVIGVDVIRTLIVPRFLALGLVIAFMNLIGTAFAISSGLIVTVFLFDAPTAGFISALSTAFVVPELVFGLLKTVAFGFIVAIVCSYKGLTVSGGSAGVGRAVNQAVVISFVAIWLFNYAWTSTQLALFPELQNLR